MNIANISEIAYHKTKGNGIGTDSLRLMECIGGTFDVIVFKGILWLFSVPVSKCPVTLKQPSGRTKQIKLWDSLASCSTYTGWNFGSPSGLTMDAPDAYTESFAK